MRKLPVVLRSTAALSVMVAAAAYAQPESTLPPPDVNNAQASTSNEQAVAASPAAEQTSQPDIIITGSRIRRDPLSQDAPVTFVDNEDIAKTGLNSLNDVLQRLPSAGGGLNGKFNNSGNLGNPPNGAGVGAGAADIDLRYLGSQRTLVLVDGLRFVSGSSASGVPGSVDINSIPESMIERVEILQDGASAIYGSDAIAGVVNIITKRHQDGFVASAQLGKYLDDGDGFSQNYQLSWGNGDGPTQIVIGANFVKQDPVRSGDRAISAFPEPFADACGGTCSSYTPAGRFFLPGFGNHTLIDFPTSTPTLANFRPFSSPGDRFNFAPYNFILTPLKRYGGFINFKQELSPTMNLSAKLVYNRRDSKNQAAPLPLGVGVDAANLNLLDEVDIDATNPFNPFGFTLDSNNYTILRRLVENGPRRYHQKVDTYYANSTLDGRLNVAGREWFWDVNALWGRNKAKQDMIGNINAAHLRQALGPVADCTGQCVPFNIFGGAGSVTPAMLDWINFEQNDSSEQKVWGVSANVSGTLAELPGGPLGVAFGVEHRDQKGRFDPDPVIVAGEGSDIPAQPTKGHYNIDEAYLEINAPLISNQPFAELLELNGAVRFSDYSISGSTTTFKGGINWKPIVDLRLRGSFSEGFRAPTIGELFGGPSRFDLELDDPCNASNNPSGTILANCQAIFDALGADLAGYEQDNPQRPVFTNGNPDLEPETSKGWNLGAVWSPRALPRFSIEANYYNIKIKNAIASPANETLYACVSTLDPVACALVNRTASGQIASINGTLGNISSIKTDGMDLNIAYRTAPASWGTLGFTLNNSFLFNYDLIVPSGDGTRKISREGTEQGSPDQAFPKHKAIGILDWNGMGFGLTLTGRYIKGVNEYPDGRDNDPRHLSSRFYTDIQGRWSPSFMDNLLELALGVNNLFDKDPPGCITCATNNFDPNMYDVPGRYYYARIGVKVGRKPAAAPAYSPPPAPLPPPPPAAEPAPVVEPAPPPPPPPAERGERGK
jgi:iron complex outermembrane receptor protein